MLPDLAELRDAHIEWRLCADLLVMRVERWSFWTEVGPEHRIGPNKDAIQAAQPRWRTRLRGAGSGWDICAPVNRPPRTDVSCAADVRARIWFRGRPAGGLDACRLPVSSDGAVRSANVHSVQPASCAGHAVGCLAGQGEVSVLPADGDAPHADDSGEYSSGKQADGCECDHGGHGGSPFRGWLLHCALGGPGRLLSGAAASPRVVSAD